MTRRVESETLHVVSLDLESLLNPEQCRAASITEGPELIIAGAGSGKTRMITYRIASMLEKGITEDQILALTFTNKAAKEMAERIREVTGKSLKKLTATTFHSFGLGILKQYIQYLGYRNDFSLYDDNDNLSLVKNCIMNKGYELSSFSASSLKAHFSSYKTEREILPEKGTAVREIYEEFLLMQKAYNVVDFDDLLVLPLRIFTEHPEILVRVQDRYRYIMVDEFQDTSLIQYKLVSMIAQKYRNIAVVGDDDQSIYSWRGANYHNILMFEKDFPERKEFRLERNYRSTGNILNAANALIVHNKERKEKKLWTEGGEGDSLTIRRLPTGDEEASWIALEIKKLMMKYKYNFRDFAVLVRTNTLLNTLETTFMENRIPVNISGGSSFFDRKEVRDMLCYLKVIVNGKDDNSLLRIINTPRRGIGRTTVEKLRACADRDNSTLEEALSKYSLSSDFNSKTQEGMRNLIQLLAKWRGMISHPDMIIPSILKETHYDISIREEFPDNDKMVSFKLHSISFLNERLQKFFRANPEKNLRDYLHSVSIAGNDDKDENSTAVNLMTMHASKGLEFKVVLLAGIEDNIIPSKRALEEDERNIDEERRLFYVAITRARERLYICYADSRMDYEGKLKSALPSRFISEIPETLFIPHVAPEKDGVKKSNLDSALEFLAMLDEMN